MLRVLPVLIILATLIYLLVRFMQSRGGGTAPPRPPRPVAPDDDPTFLRDLDEQMWRERRKEPGTD